MIATTTEIGSSNMAVQTGSTGTNVDIVEIPTANLGFSTVTSSKKVPSNNCDDDRQLEVAIWPPKAEVYLEP